MSDISQNIDKNIIQQLIIEYDQIVKDGKLSQFSEADVGAKFILRLVSALGWDINNIDEFKEQKRTLTGPADYSLNVHGKPKIIIEIKNFRENLDGKRIVRGEEESFAYQAIHYAWHLMADWCILTNFSELRLYSAHAKNPKDGLVFEITYNNLINEGFEKLNNISKQSVVSGRLDTLEKRRTRNDVDKEILADLFDMRKRLGISIRKNNNELKLEQISECVQKILDRSIVLRVAEDREVIGSDSVWN